jgi:DNA-directed RNA polymerase subunit RPC12/RpoP
MDFVCEREKFVRSRPVIECAQCGERLYVPEWTEYRDHGRVHHLWVCESCGTSFETIAHYKAA